MNSHWFKFYGQDWLTDIKMIKMSVEDRLCYLTLLCLASNTDDGIIKKCDEEAIIELTHLYNDPLESDNEFTRALGCLQRFNDNGMITRGKNGDVLIVNFLKRQESNLTGYERVKKYRENHKNKPNNDSNVINDNVNDNKVITSDKIREDKIREDKKISVSRFATPTIEEITNYCKERNNNVDPIRFFNFYESKGWMVGKNKMKKWQAAVHTWEKDTPQKDVSLRRIL